MRLEAHNFSSLAAAVVWGKEQIDASAGKARARYLTVAPGQEATYSAKYADAKSFLGWDGTPPPELHPWVTQEATRTGSTPEATATLIKNLGDYWNFVIGPNIESVRLEAKNRLDSLASISLVVSATRQAQKALDLI
jgi:hypothetical protein